MISQWKNCLLLACLAGCAWNSFAYDVRSRYVQAADLAGIVDIGGHHSGAISLSPDGKMIAFQLQVPHLESNSYVLSWMVVPTSGSSEPRIVGDGGAQIINPDKFYGASGDRLPVKAIWSDDSSSIFYLKQTEAGVQIWRSQIATGRQEQLTHHAADVMQIAMSHDGTRIYHSLALPKESVSQKLAEEARLGYLVDDRFRPFAERGPSRRWCGGGWWDAVSLERECEPEIAVYDTATTKARTPTEAEDSKLKSGSMRGAIASLASVLEEQPQWMAARHVSQWATTAEKKSYAWIENVDNEAYTRSFPPSQLFVGDDSGQGRACKHDECMGYRFIDVWMADDGDKVYFLRRVDPSGRQYGFYSWQPESDLLRPVLLSEDAFSDCSLNNGKAFCLHEAATSPRKIVSVDLETGRLDTLFDPNPEFSEFEFTVVEPMEWEDEFGNVTFGRLIYPKGYEAGVRYPLVVLPYLSRGFLRGDVGDEFPAHVFAASGLMVLTMEAPFDIGALAVDGAIEGTERELRRRRSTFSSLKNILGRLERKGLVDPENIGITGISDGAQQVHYAVINSDLVKAASVSGLVTTESWYWMEAPIVRSHLRDLYGGGPSQELPAYQALSYRNNIDNVAAAILINVPEEEYLLSVVEFAALQDADKSVEMHLYPDEYHIKRKPAHRLSIYMRNVQWFKFWLLEEEDSNPVDADQYIRWRALRDARQVGIIDVPIS